MKTHIRKLCRGGALALLLFTCPQPALAATPEYHFVDLTPHALWPWNNYRPSHEWTPPVEGRRTFNGVPFELTGIVQLTGVNQTRGGDFRAPSAAFAIDRKFTRIHLLHHSEFRAATGTPAAHMILRYADDTEHVFTLRYGLHFQDWYHFSRTRMPMGATTQYAWLVPQLNNLEGTPLSGLWQTAVPNPHPDKLVREIAFRTVFGPVSYTLDALTLEQGEPLPELVEDGAMGRSLPTAARLLEHRIRFVDQTDGRPVAGGRVNAWLKSGESLSTWGTYQTDSTGAVLIRVPENQNLPLELAVVGTDHVPTWCSVQPRRAGGDASEAVEFNLAAGKVIGGRVVDEAGEPVEGAQVAISGIMSGSAGGFTLCHWPAVRTDSLGRWSIGAAPDDFKNLTLQVTHQDHLPASYDQGEDDDAFMISAVDLLKREARMELTRGLTLSGAVTDAGGRPVAGARLTYFPGADPRALKQRTRSNADGSFKLGSLLPGDGVLVATAPGFSPALLRERLEPGGQPWRVQLEPSRPLDISLKDPDGTPVAFAHVMLIDWQDGAWVDWMGQTGFDGRLTWDAAPATEARYLVTAPGLSAQAITLTADGSPREITLQTEPQVKLKVVDAATGQPVNSFIVIRGMKYSDTHTQWEDHNPLAGANGEFQMELDRTQQAPYGFAFQVQARGYQPAVSASFRSTTNLLVKLERGVPPRGVVVDDAGRPVGGVQLVLASEQNHAYMDQPPAFRAMGRSGNVTNNADGTFELPIVFGALGVYAAHPEAGFGSATLADLRSSGKIVLHRWARVEGTLKVGEQVSADQTVSLHRSNRAYYDPKDLSQRLSVFARATPTPDGRFIFEKVPPVPLEVALQYPTGAGQSIIWSHAVPLELSPGMSTNVMIGGTGRSVIGRVKVPEELATELVFDRDMHQLTAIPSVQQPSISWPSGQLTPEERQAATEEYNARMRAFSQSAEGRRLRLEQKTYVIRFATNGTFRCDHVPPGKYNLRLNFTKPGANEYQHEPLVNHHQQVVIEPGDEPVDLGEIVLRGRSAVRPGRPAPEIPMTGLDGKPVRLADFRGRHLLLVLWGKELPGYEKVLDGLQALHERLAGNEKMAILTLAAQLPVAEVKAIAEEKGYRWTHAVPDLSTPEGNELMSGYAMAGGHPGNANWQPALAHLIDPAGNLMISVAEVAQLVNIAEQIAGLPARPSNAP